MNEIIITTNPDSETQKGVKAIGMHSKYKNPKITIVMLWNFLDWINISKRYVIKVASLSRLVLILGSVTFTLPSYAQETKNTLASNKVTLTIKPHICVAPRGETSCISTIDISWSSTNNGDYCLQSDRTETPLLCWQNNNSGFYQHKLIFDKNITYLMNDELTRITLANAVMKFKSLKPHRKYKKRRSRFPWSISSL